MTLFGLGLREPLHKDVLSGTVDLDFVEIISENYMVSGGRPLATLRKVRDLFPVAMHGVSLSIGSASGIDQDYLQRLKALVGFLDPMFISDHLCWTRVPGFSSHDLLPLPCTEEVLTVVTRHVHEVQQVLGRQILLENPSAYLGFAQSEMPEWEFLSELCVRSGCGLLLDVNNVYVSARNIGFDPSEYIAHFPMQNVKQIHLAGHSQGEQLLVDTHDQPVCDAVWDLFELAMARAGDVAVMIERDSNIPIIDVLLDELEIARARSAQAVGNAKRP